MPLNIPLRLHITQTEQTKFSNCHTDSSRVGEWNPSKSCQYRTSHGEDLDIQKQSDK